MKTIDVVKLAREQGHKISYRTRTDGGIVVTSVDGIKTSGSVGNTLVRKLTGQALTEEQIEQRVKITPQKGISEAKKRSKGYSKISTELEKKLKKTQRIWNKEQVKKKKGGSVTKKGIRYIVEHEGEAAAFEALNKAEQYARGIAYKGNVTALAERLRRMKIMTNNTSLHQSIEDVALKIEDNAFMFKEEWIIPISELIYDCEKTYDEEMIMPTLNSILRIMGI